MVNTDFQRTTGFEQAFFDITPNSHDLTGSFHLRSQMTFSMFKLIKRKTWNFSYHIVQSWFKHGISCACDRIDNFI